MVRFILRRLVASVVSMIVISMIVLVLSRNVGDPLSLMLSQYATAEQTEVLRAKLHLDDSLPVQWWFFVKDAVRGDFGKGIQDQRPVMTQIIERFPRTLELGAAAFIFSLLLGVPLGVLSSINRNSIWDQAGKLIALLGQSVPSFWLGIMMIFLFAVNLGWVPASGRIGWTSYILPTITLGSFFVAANLRIVRSAMLDVLDSEYVKLARAKGVSPAMVIWKHALRNALIPPLTYFGITLGFLVTGSITAEMVFAWPGLGLLAFQAVPSADYPILQGVVMVTAAIYLGASLVVDILYAYVNPRIRYS